MVSEGGVAAGVRRLECLTGKAAYDYLAGQGERLEEVASVLKAAPADVPARVAALLDERRALEKELAETRRKLAAGGDGSGGGDIKEVAGIKLVPRLLQDMPAKDLKGLADDLKNQVGSGVVALVSVNDGKASLVVGVTDDLTDRISAIDLVRAGSAAVGGKGGGGRPDMAQAGGPDGGKAQAALDAIESALPGG